MSAYNQQQYPQQGGAPTYGAPSPQQGYGPQPGQYGTPGAPQAYSGYPQQGTPGNGQQPYFSPAQTGAQQSYAPQYNGGQAQYGAPPPGQWAPPPPAGQYPQVGQYGSTSPPPQMQQTQYGGAVQTAGYTGPNYAGSPPPQGQYGGAPPPGQYPPLGQYPSQGQYPVQGGPQAPAGYGQPQQAPYYAHFSGAPMSGPPHIPRTYLGTPIHPFDNALLVGPHSNEMVPADVSVDGYQPMNDVEKLKKATKGFGSDSKALNAILVPLRALDLTVLNAAFKGKHNHTLEHLIEKETTGHHELILRTLLHGPLNGDVNLVHKACDGLGTNESLLTDLIVGRPPLGMDLLRAAFKRNTQREMDHVILEEFSLMTKSAFTVVLRGEWQDCPNYGRTADCEVGVGPGQAGPGGFLGAGGVAGSAPNPAMLQDDLVKLKSALTQNDHMSISPLHLHFLQADYLLQNGEPITRAVKRIVSGHLKHALLYALEGGKKDTNGCWRDAKMLFKTMEGAGTNDKLLIVRLVRAHWDKPRFKIILQAYQKKYGTSLARSITKETSGHYRETLLAIVNSV